jgi:hypothetical protein
LNGPLFTPRGNRRRFCKLAAATLALPVTAGCGRAIEPDPAVPRSPFDDDSTASDVTEGLDLTGRIIVVTGCTSGIGFETMRVLALRGAYMVGTGRTLEKAQIACSKVRGLTTPVALELSDFDSRRVLRRAASWRRARCSAVPAAAISRTVTA